MSITRANPHLEEIVEILNIHRNRYRTDDEARAYLAREENEWIDKELLHCMGEARYFISNYFAYRDEHKGFRGLYPFFDSQEILHEFYRGLEKKYGRVRALVLKARQMGSSTYNIAEFFHKTIFSEHTNGIIVAQHEKQSGFMMGMYESAYDFLPWWMKPRIHLHQTGTQYTFDEPDETIRQTRPGLKTNIFADNANKPSGVGRGMTFRRCLMSELAFWKNASQLSKSLLRAMNSPDGFYVMESTANGRNNAWHNLWRRAEQGLIDWHPEFIPFYRRPVTYSLPIASGQEFVVTAEEKEMRDRVVQMEKYTISDETFNWMRKTKQEFIATDGDDMLFSQEYTCLVGPTRVSTSEGLIPIAELKDRIGLAVGGDRITGWFPQGKAPVLRATTALGYSIVGTAEHRVPTLDGGDIPLGKLQNHEITLVAPQFSCAKQNVEWTEVFDTFCSLRINEPVARFLGYFIGDGCYTNGTVNVCCDGKDADVIEDVHVLMTHLFGGCNQSTVGNRKGGVQLRVGTVGFKKVMQKLGIWQAEKPHRRVVVPEVIFRSPRSVVREFLRGLFEADGFCGYEGNRVSLFAKGQEFLRNIQVLLLGFGITSRITTQKKINGHGHQYVGHALELRSAEALKFCEDIGFISNRKRSRKRVDETHIGRPQAKIELRDRVVSVEVEGEAEVFDITVANCHLFSANGILVHNSTPDESFQNAAATAFPRGVINKYSKRCRNPKWIGEIYYDFERGKPVPVLTAFAEGQELFYPVENNRLHVFEKPIKGERYCVGVDVSLGNFGGDYSCIQVLRISSGHEIDAQVAVWHGYLNPEPLAEVVLAICWWYEEAMAAVEVNAMGMVTNTLLMRQFEYDNIYRFKRMDRLKHFMTDIVGWWTDYKSRRALYTKLDRLLRENQIDLPCRFTVDEFRDLTEDGAEGDGAHDDYSMALMIACYCAHEGEFQDKRMEAAAKAHSNAPSANKFIVTNREGVLQLETTSQRQAELTASKIIGAQIQRIAGATATLHLKGQNRQIPADYQNTAYSPIHDREGAAHKLHYEEEVPAEMITPEMIQEWEDDNDREPEDREFWMVN